MARGTVLYQQAYGNVTAYKNLYGLLSGILTTALPRTADTGQVNWGAVATEPTAVRDFEIFSLGGPLAGVAPIFVRFDYKGGSGGTVTVTVGTATDGAGALSGLTVAALPLQGHSISNVANLTAWAASDRETYLVFAFALDVVAAGSDGVGMIVVERTRDPDGTANGAGFHVWRWQATNGAVTDFAGGWSKVYAAGTQPVAVDWNPAAYIPDHNNLASAFKGSTSYCFPAITYAGFVPGGASQALMWGLPGDFPRGTAITVTHYGQPMTYVPMGDAVKTKAATMSSVSAPVVKDLVPLIRWD